MMAVDGNVKDARMGMYGFADRHLVSQLRFALARSQVRQKVLRSLATRSPQYLSEIVRATGLGIPGVTGALRGSGQRYAAELSLKALGLVEEKELGPRFKVFEITPLGERVAHALSEDDGHLWFAETRL